MIDSERKTVKQFREGCAYRYYYTITTTTLLHYYYTTIKATTTATIVLQITRSVTPEKQGVLVTPEGQAVL